jgi:ATP-dependent Clp protease ATP-binding subunit ClpX
VLAIRSLFFSENSILDILFICSGAFTGLTKIIGNRTNKKSLGFTLEPAKASIGKQSKMAQMQEKHKQDDKFLEMVEAGDLHTFGLIPEFVGRLQGNFLLKVIITVAA